MTEPDDTPAESETGGSVFSPTLRTYLRRLAHGLAVLLVLVAVIPFVVYAVPQVVGAEHSYVVLSGSMEPTLSPGDVTIVDAADPATIEQGDVITYLRDGETRTTTHRVVEVTERDGEPAFRTKGDANEDADQGVVLASQVRGRIMTVGGHLVVFPFVGYVIQFANTQTGFALLFVVPLVLLIANEIWNVVSSARRNADGAAESDGSDGGRTVGVADHGVGDGPAIPEEFLADFEAVPREATDAGSGGSVSFRPAELRLGVLVLGAFVAYSAAMAVRSPGVWTIGIAASAGAALFLLGGLYARGRLSGDESSPAPSALDDGVTIEFASHAGDDDGRRVPVTSLETLVAVAGTVGGRIRQDPDDGAFSLQTDERTYVYAPDAVGRGTPVLEACDADDLASIRAGDRSDATDDRRGVADPAEGRTTEADDD